MKITDKSTAMKITVVSIVRNEAIILPFFLRHYLSIVDRFIFFDDASTDGTRDIIRDCPVAELRDNFMGGVLDDATVIKIKNEVYQQEPGDWFFMIDADEFLHHRNLRDLLFVYELHGTTLPRIEGWDMVGDYIPQQGLLTDHVRLGVRNPFMDKMIVVHAGVQVNYEPGAHTHHASPHTESERAEIKLLHYKYLSKGFVLIKAASRRLSASNHAHRWDYTNGRPSSESWEAVYDDYHGRREKVI